MTSTVKNILVIAGGLLVLAVMAFYIFGTQDEGGEKTVPPQEKAAMAPSTQAHEGGMAVDSETEINMVDRMVAAPVYNDYVAVSQILNKALDMKEAREFTIARTSLRVMRDLEETSKLAAADANSRLDKAKAEAQLKRLNEGKGLQNLGLEPVPGETIAGANLPGGFSPVGGGVAGTSTSQEADKDTIEMISRPSNAKMMLRKGKVILPSVRVGQTVFGRYQIKSLDIATACVTVYDHVAKVEIPPVCYAG
jgi:hypothetical protein